MIKTLLTILVVSVLTTDGKFNLSCKDGSDFVCKCPGDDTTFKTHRHHCEDMSKPVCVCQDGSEPVIEPSCKDGNYPVCPGACPDGSDAIMDGYLSTPLCKDGSHKIKWNKCKCEDGTPFRRRPGKKNKNKKNKQDNEE